MSSDDLPHQAIELRDLLCAEEAWQRQQPQQLAKQAASDEGAAEAASPHAAPEAQPAKRLPPPRPQGWAGPSPLPLLRPGQRLPAWLAPDPPLFRPAAGGRSFGPSLEEAHPAEP